MPDATGELQKPGRILHLSRAEVESVALPMKEIIARVEEALRERGEGRVEMPPKPGLHTRPDAFIHAMPAYLPAMNAAGIKWVSGYPTNQARGLPYIAGLIILNDPETGLPYAVMDCTWVTAYRTAAASAVAAKYLARPDSAVLGILACGVQGRTNLEALAEVLPIRRVLAFDTDAGVLRRYVDDMRARFRIDIEAVPTAREAVVASDVVVTSGPILKAPAPAIPAGWLRPGAFAVPLDFDSYWSGDAFRQIDKLATDDRPQYDFYVAAGYFQNTPNPYADLGEIVTGRRRGREDARERTMALNLGLAIEDMAVAPEIYRRARASGVGTWLDL